jgi:predicted Zn finger-like uncharacterized protein
VSDKQPKYTGRRCPACKERFAIIDNLIGGRVAIMRCPISGNRWTAEGPPEADLTTVDGQT